MEQATLNMFTSFISQVGFPIFVAVWMLVRGSKDSRELRDAVNRLTSAIEMLIGPTRGGKTE